MKRKAGSISTVLSGRNRRGTSDMWFHIGAALPFAAMNLDHFNIFRCWPLEPFVTLKLTRWPSDSVLNPSTEWRSEANKHIATFISFDETKAFAFVEPFDFTF